jgi:hypothetical protein
MGWPDVKLQITNHQCFVTPSERSLRAEGQFDLALRS